MRPAYRTAKVATASRRTHLVNQDELNLSLDPVELHLVENGNVQDVLHGVVVSVFNLIHEDGINNGRDNGIGLGRFIVGFVLVPPPPCAFPELKVELVLCEIVVAVLDIGESEAGELQEDVVKEFSVVEDLKLQVVHKLVLPAFNFVNSEGLHVSCDGLGDGVVQGEQLNDVIYVVAPAVHYVGNNGRDVRPQALDLGHSVVLRQLHGQLVVNILTVACTQPKG